MYRFGIFFSFVLFLLSGTANSQEVDDDVCNTLATNALSHKLVLMDAGSSGVRAMAYCFEKTAGSPVFDLKYQTPLIEGQKLESHQPLPDEFTHFLTRYRPATHSQNIARDFFLGATAGLRSVDGQLARNILAEKAGELTGLNYTVEYNNNIRLLSGLEEGSYTWFGVNFIMQAAQQEQTIAERIKKMVTQHRHQFGIIEIGGGSVQIAFRIPKSLEHKGLRRDTDQYSARPEEANVKTFRLLDQYELEVFANSQLRKGLKYAYDDLEEKYSSNPAANPCLVKGTPVRENGAIRISFGNYDDCMEAINNTIFKPVCPSFDSECRGEAIFDKAYKDLLPDKFFLTGYFFDRTTAMGLPEVLTPAYLEGAARHVCNMDYQTLVINHLGHRIYSRFLWYGLPVAKTNDIFLKYKLLQGGIPRTGEVEKYCTHLTHMSLILKKIGLSPDHKLYTQKSLFYRHQGYGVSWPLGYAILTTNGWE